MRFIYAEYIMYNNSVDVTTFYGYILRVDCNVAEEGLRTTPCSQPDFMDAIDYMFKDLERRKLDYFAVKQYKKYKLASGVICSK